MDVYNAQTTEIEVNGSQREARIRQGLRQSCLFLHNSPYLFYLFIEREINEMEDHSREIPINGHQIHSIHFTDDVALLDDSEEELSLMLRHILNSSLAKFKLKLKNVVVKIKKMSIGDEVCFQLTR